MATIYLSSTYEDLKAHRSAVFDALRRSGYEVIAMEDYVARDDRPLGACLDDVERADVYVGLFAFRYGYIPPVEHGNPDGLSITELEFRHADASAKTSCLIFLAEEGTWDMKYIDSVTGDGERGELIQRLRRELSSEKMASFFSGTYELASKVQTAISKHLAAQGTTAQRKAEPTSEITWNIAEQGSPYPGLMHFTRRYAPVFFGREPEVHELLDRLALPDGRFVIVSGDSGTGKSSLVNAGVLPRLENSSQDRSLRCIRMLPSGGENPFDALLRALHPLAERAGLEAYRLGRDLATERAGFAEVLTDILNRGMEADILLLFLDQMEELFTVPENDPALVSRFLSGLYAATQTLPLQVIATIRSDSLHHCYAHPEMLSVLKGSGSYPLGHAMPHMLHEMIVHPARCAGIEAPEALARRLVLDMGTEPGNLPLLAFVLQRLFEQRRDEALSEVAYENLGGLTGAIAEHVKQVVRVLEKELRLGREELDGLLAELFEDLVRVDREGLPTRRRAHRKDLPARLTPVIEALITARLLTGEGEGTESLVSVAHERLFQAWPALVQWIAEHQNDLRLLRQGELDAVEWHGHDHDLAFLWHVDRLKLLQAVIANLPPERASEELRAFAWPQQALLGLLASPALDHENRDSIGHYFAELGDPRPGVGVNSDETPQIEWVFIPGGEVKREDGTGMARVNPFHISRYLTTNVQFQAFVDAVDGYVNSRWWLDMPWGANDGPDTPGWPEPNRPRETVSWYQARAYCRWLSQRLSLEIRLPTKFEWQQAATSGNPDYRYPWGLHWDTRYCNTLESGLNRTVAVGLYPASANAQGVLDLCGNLWEWCDDEYDSVTRVLRGGSWNYSAVDARASYCNRLGSDLRDNDVGFRVVCASPKRKRNRP